MVEAREFQALANFLWLWQAYDPEVKSDLYSTALLTQNHLLVVDPIPLSAAAWKELTAERKPTAVLLTNSNHLRNATALARQEKIDIFAARSVGSEFEHVETRVLLPGRNVVPGITAIEIDGAAPGEMAFHFVDEGGTLVIGDAVINVEPYGFALLPVKYCADQRKMRDSLRRLLDLPFERLLFAHGTPLLTSPRTRLAKLLGS
jgi:glyoxylase-like metal-dependent hydrolase (beta-lactamase superfamily II)